MAAFVLPEEIEKALPFPDLIQRIGDAFVKNHAVTPARHHHDYKNPPADKDSTLLLMPSWVPGKSLGVKVVTISPNNSKYHLPSIQGIYLLFDAATGVCRLQLDAKSLTVRRTAATSALASSMLSRKDSSTLLMIGTGALAASMIQAHASVRPITQVFVWGRNPERASVICEKLGQEEYACHVSRDLKEAISQADIISCATLSQTPLIDGSQLRNGQHLDLVGSYLPGMREADDEAILRSQIFIDHADALKESGDMAIPISKGLISTESIRGDLHQLCSGRKPGRTTTDEITLFKSVGHALEDLVAAEMVYKSLYDRKLNT